MTALNMVATNTVGDHTPRATLDVIENSEPHKASDLSLAVRDMSLTVLSDPSHPGDVTPRRDARAHRTPSIKAITVEVVYLST